MRRLEFHENPNRIQGVILSSKHRSDQPRPVLNSSLALGRLEIVLMEMLWGRGRSSVREVFERLRRPLAYTTVMTTLERLFKKGFLEREKSGRAFFYVPRFSRQEWEQMKVDRMIAGYFCDPSASRELLISCLIDAVSQHDEALLDELEKKVQGKRRELSRRGRL